MSAPASDLLPANPRATRSTSKRRLAASSGSSRSGAGGAAASTAGRRGPLGWGLFGRGFFASRSFLASRSFFASRSFLARRRDLGGSSGRRPFACCRRPTRRPGRGGAAGSRRLGHRSGFARWSGFGGPSRFGGGPARWSLPAYCPFARRRWPVLRRHSRPAGPGRFTSLVLARALLSFAGTHLAFQMLELVQQAPGFFAQHPNHVGRCTPALFDQGAGALFRLPPRLLRWTGDLSSHLLDAVHGHPNKRCSRLATTSKVVLGSHRGSVEPRRNDGLPEGARAAILPPARGAARSP